MAIDLDELAPRKPKPQTVLGEDLSAMSAHELESRIAALEAEIAKLTKTIADPDLYARDRTAFDKASAALGKAQTDLAAAEDEWLRLEELREQVEAR